MMMDGWMMDDEDEDEDDVGRRSDGVQCMG